MKMIMTALTCALIAPLVLTFAQTTTTRTTTTTETVTVTGTYVETKTETGTAANYQPARTLVIRTDGSTTPGQYVLDARGSIVNKKGEFIRTPIKPGTRVSVVYADVGGRRVVDHVVVEE